jgi:transcriptional regulator GlxA family with amidase domain
MAKTSGYQRTHLANQIKQLTGDSPTQHLKRLRVERARSLLRTTNHTITEITHQCGFATSQHFARIFRQFTLTSASDYRDQAGLPK